MKKKAKKYIISRMLGTKVKDLRRNFGMTQEELAEKLDIHPSYVGQLERGEREASLHTLEKLADTFALPPAELLGEEKDNADREALIKECEKLLQLCSPAQLATVRDMLSAFIYRKK